MNVTFLCARLDEDERVALAASGRYGRPVTEPEHWHWECIEDDEPIDVDLAIAGNEKMLDHGEHFRVGLRSIEQYPTYSVGLLPHLVIDCEKVRQQDARHIARHDPARALREVEVKRTILAGLEEEQARRLTLRDSMATEDNRSYQEGYADALRDCLCRLRRQWAAIYSDHPDYRQGMGR